MLLMPLAVDIPREPVGFRGSLEAAHLSGLRAIRQPETCYSMQDERLVNNMAEILRTIETKKVARDLQGMVIPKGTTLYVTEECPPHPVHGYHILKVRVDNGARVAPDGKIDLSLMPETCVRDVEVEGE